MGDSQAVADLTGQLTDYVENSWHRFCLRKDEEPRMWPASIRMRETVLAFDGLSDELAMKIGGPRIVAGEGEIYRATSNPYGAVCAVVDGKLLGVKPAEFEIVTWQDDRPASESLR